MRRIIKTSINQLLPSHHEPLQKSFIHLYFKVRSHSPIFCFSIKHYFKLHPNNLRLLPHSRGFRSSVDWKEKEKEEEKPIISSFFSSSGLVDETNQTHRDFLFLKLSHLSPETIRRFWRVSTLKPQHALEILRGFESNSELERRKVVKVDFLWKLFNWVLFNQKSSEGEIEFKDHFPKSYDIMGSMLIDVGMLREARTLLGRGGLLDEVLGSKIIERYVDGGDLDNSILMYGWMRSRGFVPSRSCFRVLLNYLIERNKSKLAFGVYSDMVEVGFTLNNEDMAAYEFITKYLCKKGKVREARKLVRKLTFSGFEPSPVVLDTLADAYCEKRDFEDLLNFFKEWKCSPCPRVCNKSLSYQCRKYGTEQAYLFMMEMEHLGFIPDEVTFGIFISWSCREGKLKDAFVYLSELLSRCLKPDIRLYNVLISGVFKDGMPRLARNILLEMIERGSIPDLSTFRVLLAGYCKFRLFDEAKEVVREMVSHDLIQLTSLEDPLSKAFSILGFEPSAIKVKRDNDAGLCKSEFFDALGNGLYLGTDLDEYEKTVTEVLEDAFLSDFNSLILEECDKCNARTALTLKDNIIRRGGKLSLSACSALVKCLCKSRSHKTKAADLLEEMPELACQLDLETLSLLIRVINKKRIPYKRRLILEGILQRKSPIDDEAYADLIMGLCKNGSPKELRECWALTRKNKWLPNLRDFKALVECLCQQKMFDEVLELFMSMLETSVNLDDMCNIFLEVFCSVGHTSIGLNFVQEVLGERLVLNDMAYNNLIRGFCKEKEYQKALGVLDTLQRKNMILCVDVYIQLISQLCNSGRSEDCMILKDIMLEKEPESSLSVYRALISGLCKAGKIGLATLQFQEMIEKGIIPDGDIYNIMVQGHSQDNNSRKVGELLGVMVRQNIRISLLSFRRLVCLICKCDTVFLVFNLKEYMLRENKSSLVIYNILIFHLSQTGNKSLIDRILQEMNMKGLIFDEVTYNFLVLGYYKCNAFPKAMEAFESMIGKDLSPSSRSLTMVIRHLCSHGNLDEALKLSRLMESRGWVHGSIVQHDIMEGLLSYGRLLEAEKYFNQIQEGGMITKSVSFDIPIKQFCWHGKLNIAVDLLNLVLKKGGVPGPASYDSVIQAFCSCHALNEALDFHAEMMAWKFKPSIRSWDMLVEGLCRNGWTAESERLLDSMHHLGQTPTRNMYQLVIDRYCLENNPSKASELLHKMQQKGYVPDFSTHWSLISNLSNLQNKKSTETGGFLKELLSLSGFSQRKDAKTKVG